MQHTPTTGGSEPDWLVIERVLTYLDGFNIYNGMIGKGWGRYRWLDYPAPMRRYMRGPQQLVGIKYFTAPMTHQPDRYARQKLYLEALEARGHIDIIQGQFTTQSHRCKKCGKSFKVPREKCTDVNIALHIVVDAYEDRFDTFMICTADSDLTPAIRHVQNQFHKKFILLDPPRRHSGELASLADQRLRSRRPWFHQCQLPDPVEYLTRRGRTRRIHRPPSWATNEVTSSISEPDDDGVLSCLTCGQVLGPKDSEQSRVAPLLPDGDTSVLLDRTS